MIPFKVNLKNKVVVITGAGGILGSTFAKALAECEAKIAVLDLNGEAADKVANEIIASGGCACGFIANVLEKHNLMEVKEQINEKLGTVDVLVNAAGGNHPGATTSKEYFYEVDMSADKKINTFFDLDIENMEATFNLNFMGTLLPSQVFAKDMINKREACIVNISSMSAFVPPTKVVAYSAAKAAVNNFTQWLAVHMSKTGIRVNAIAPGFFLTKQNEGLLLNEDGSYNDRANKIVNRTPMERFGKPEELVGTLLWLIDSSASGFVNGTVIPVDGGFLAYSGV